MADKRTKAMNKIAKVMREFKAGTLRSSSGQLVTDRAQAIAISLIDTRRAGAKVPKKRRKS